MVLTAVDKVDLTVPERAIASIIGPNGAGKTTFFNCVSGFYTPEEGDVLFYGKPIQGNSTDKICKMGISRTYQNIRLFSQMTAIENIIIGKHPRLKGTWLEAILHNRRYMLEEEEAVKEALHCWNLSASKALVIISPATCHTAHSGGWKLPAPLPTIQNCSCWMNPPQA